MHQLRRAIGCALILLATSATTVAVLVVDRPRLSGGVGTWGGDELALVTAWLFAVVCAAWLGAVALACLAALSRGRRGVAHRIAGWAPPVARRALQTALIGTWALAPTYAYAAAPAPVTVQIGPSGRLAGIPATGSPAEIPVVRSPRPIPARSPDAGSRAGVPARAPVPAQPVAVAVSTRHVVRAGESLWSIASDEVTRAGPGADRDQRVVGAYWQRLVAANRATLRSGDPSLIYPGEVVTRPAI